MINRRSGQRTAIHSRRQMWYVYGTSAHKMYVYGGFISESLAMSKANEVMDWDNDYQTIQLPTTDLTAAKSMIKAKLTGQSGSLGVGTQRIFRGGKNKMGMFDKKKSAPTHLWYTYGTVNHILKVYGGFEDKSLDK